MTDEAKQDRDNGREVVSMHTMEIAVALVIMAFAAVVIVSNYRLGASWGPDGPETGYFPFYVGVVMLIASTGILVQQVLRKAGKDEGFVEHRPLVRVIQILIPTILYVVLTGYIGIYVPTAIMIAGFMIWLGRYRTIIAVPVGIAISVALFVTFEIWFLVPLPKGPVEAWLGY